MSHAKDTKKLRPLYQTGLVNATRVRGHDGVPALVCPSFSLPHVPGSLSAHRTFRSSKNKRKS